MTLAGLAALTLILAELDAFERIYGFSRAHEDYELDEIITALFASPVILLVFTFRRLNDLKKEIKRRVTAEADLRHLAQTDLLTGLPNRHFFFDALQKRLNPQTRSSLPFALIQVDLDRFKHVNDRLGPAFGDHILKQVAHLLAENTSKDWMLARIGGDEFVIAADVQQEADAKAIATELATTLKRSFIYQNTECTIGVSIGVAVHDINSRGDDTDPETLLMNADIALHRAKVGGRNRIEVFEPSFRSDFEKNTVLSNDLLRAIANKEFFPVYQPLVDSSTKKIVGAEALVRWRHPTRGVLPPAVFMDLAQTLGVLADIDQAMFEEAVKKRKTWERMLQNPPRISVNISAERLKSPSFLSTVQAAGVQPNTIIFEISEAVTFEELDDVSKYNLDALEGLGVEVEIDDFGSGRASILSLLEMKPRRLKIDRNLTAPVVESEQARSLVASILDIARTLSIEVVAEGVETSQHADILTEQGCTLLQGYYFSRPIEEAAFEALLQSDEARNTTLPAHGNVHLTASAG
ncbi:bifunctional diguanylate cyclase/phosphodiesterase [uncultured Roseibium sp.]|uniref:putative bifunctional diguanylate cyclase/phosphodiesterase n=1 Tax=uncultured Roseibium sp. TaxID=1936171 RepID=UPI0026103F3D|nr:bifunctional diguanylate cyclase/phosphodiesterase [uncultured Roseibium sp.]